MSWLGMLIGAILGWWVAGPFGAVIGALLGQGLSSTRVQVVHISQAQSLRAQQAFFTASFSVMGHIAKADGHVSENEIQAARAVMAHMNLDAARQRAAIELFNRGKEPGFDLEETLLELRNACRGRGDVLRMFLQIQLHAALADGGLHPAEQLILDRICAVLGILPQEMYQYIEFIRAQQSFRGQQGTQRSEGRLEAAYRTLGVTKESTDAQIKTVYRRLMKENHPDKLMAKGLPPEMLRMAEEKVQQINASYDVIKEARGIK
jgi:DnaJ like chaperone protein